MLMKNINLKQVNLLSFYIKLLTTEEATVFCQARSHVSDRLEVSLVGATPSVADGRSLIRVSKDDKSKSPFSCDVFDGL